MSFPAQFLADIPKLEDYREPMHFLPSALAERAESYRADKSPGAGKARLADLSGLDMRGVKLCDYFAPLEFQMLVVEDTQLLWDISNQLREGVKSPPQISSGLAGEFLQKMSGGAKVLDALYAKFVAGRGGEENPPQTQCEFWIVVTDTESQRVNALTYGMITRRAGKILEKKLSAPYVLVRIVDKDAFAASLESRLPAE